MRLAKLGLVLVGGLATVAGSVWGASVYVQNFATRDDLVLVQVQVQSLYDARIEQLTIQRDRIARKEKKTEKDLQDLRDIEKELELARKMRSIK